MSVKLYAPLAIDEEMLEGISIGENIAGHPLLAEAVSAEQRGADVLMVTDAAPFSLHEEAIHLLRALCETVCIPVVAAGAVKRLEDVKKYLYAGAEEVILIMSDPVQSGLLSEASERFGKEKISAAVDASQPLPDPGTVTRFAGRLYSLIRPESLPEAYRTIPVVFFEREKTPMDGLPYFAASSVAGYVHTAFTASESFPIALFKRECLEKGGDMYVLRSALPWDAFKTGENGLVPVIVQDFENDEVLMMAYMNRASYEETLETGKMVYYSRSRKERWLKGETSGHYQYVRSLSIDCDRDTILAKVIQVGAACHTGNRSCFFTPLADTGIRKKSPEHVFTDVFATILDRKNHPKEGS